MLRLHLGDRALGAWIVRRGEPHQIGEFPETPSGHDEFSRFLTRQAASGHHLVLDHANPRLIAETLPTAGFLANRRMLDLRLERLYPDTRWRCAFRLPAPAASGRSIAFLALPETPALQGWLDDLATASIRLRGIHCTPQLLAPFLARRRRLAARLLVVSQHEQATRLCLLQQGRPAALAQEAHTPPERIPEAIAHFRHHVSLSGTTEAAPDTLCLLGTAKWQEQIEVPGKPLRIVTRHADSNIDLLALPAWRWPRPRFPTPELPHQNHRRIARALWLAGSVAGIGGLALTLAAQSTLETRNAEIDRTRARLRSLEQESRELENKARQLGLTTAQLPHLAGERKQLGARRDDFASSLRQLAAALDETPGIDLDALEWSTAAPAAAGETWQMQVAGRLSLDAALAPASLHQLSERLRSRGMRVTVSTTSGTANFSLRLTADRK
jgi:hypothetical protein